MADKVNKRRRVEASADKDEGVATSVFRGDLFGAEARASVREKVCQAKPYQHVEIHEVGHPDFMRSLRDELLRLPGNYKETDLFKLYQTPDFANIDPDAQPELRTEIPCILQLRKALYSPEFRQYVQDITGCPPLTDKTDMAASIFPQGGHLLVHDDVIGTRAISYILYFGDSNKEWEPQDGGALELYPVVDGIEPVPSVNPTARLYPKFNTLAMFRVLPGKSYHAVQEVYGQGLNRLSLQGWFHAEKAPEGTQHSTREQVKRLYASLQKPFSPRVGIPFTEADRRVANARTLIGLGMNPAYASSATLEALSATLKKEASVQLVDFLEPLIARQLLEGVVAMDQRDHLGGGRVPQYTSGEGNGWSLVGPSHIRRYALLEQSDAETKGVPDAQNKLVQLRDELFGSDTFAAFVSDLCGCAVSESRIECRRFRPGLDYTVASMPDETPRIDVTYCVVDDQDAENEEAWMAGDCGGFECFMTAEDESNPEVVAVYDGKAEANVTNVLAKSNCVSVFLRKPTTVRFVKYVSAFSPGSRWELYTEFNTQP